MAHIAQEPILHYGLDEKGALVTGSSQGDRKRRHRDLGGGRVPDGDRLSQQRTVTEDREFHPPGRWIASDTPGINNGKENLLSYHFSIEVAGDFDDVVDRTVTALKQKGFGILTPESVFSLQPGRK